MGGLGEDSALGDFGVGLIIEVFCDSIRITMNIPHWVNGLDRTAYVDEQFAKIGRLLFWAQKFEGMCKALNNLLQIFEHVKTLAEEKEEFDLLVAKLAKLNLNGHIQEASKVFDSNDISKILHTAREARNQVAHGLTLGLEDVFGNLEEERELERRIQNLAQEIVEGEYACILISASLSNEEIPPDTYVESTLKWIVDSR